MKGSVRKRGSTWSYCFDLGTIEGKRQRKEKGGFATKKAAEKALAAAINEYNSTGEAFTPSDMTVSDYLDQWYRQQVQMNLKHSTQTNYASVIRNHLKPALGPYRIGALKPAAIQEYINGLKQKGFARNTVSGILSVLSASLNYAVEPLRYIQANPCDRVRMPKYEQVRQELHVCIPPEDMQKVFEKFPAGSPFYLPTMIGYYTGLRISECFGLTWDKIDLTNNIITVDRQILKHEHQWYLDTPKTSSSVRSVKFGPKLAAALKDAKHAKDLNRMKYGGNFIEYYIKPVTASNGDARYQVIFAQRSVPADLDPLDLVCVKDNGIMLTSESYKYACRIIHNELHIAFNYHSLRHTHATMLIEAGANIKDVQERMGHNNIETTMNAYVHNTDTLRNQTADIFERISLNA